MSDIALQLQSKYPISAATVQRRWVRVRVRCLQVPAGAPRCRVQSAPCSSARVMPGTDGHTPGTHPARCTHSKGTVWPGTPQAHSSSTAGPQSRAQAPTPQARSRHTVPAQCGTVRVTHGTLCPARAHSRHSMAQMGRRCRHSVPGSGTLSPDRACGEAQRCHSEPRSRHGAASFCHPPSVAKFAKL